MFWASHGGTTAWAAPEAMGTFKMTIDADCLIENGDGMWIIGTDSGPKKRKGIAAIAGILSCMGIAMLWVVCKYLKHHYIDGLSGREKYELK